MTEGSDPQQDLTYRAPVGSVDLRAFDDDGHSYEIWACHDCLPWHAEVVAVEVFTGLRDECLVRAPADVSLPDGCAMGINKHRLYAHNGTARFTVVAQCLVVEAPAELMAMDLLGNSQPRACPPRPQP